jgi:hypothetical protein
MHHPRTRPTAAAVGITRGGLALDHDRSGHRRFQYLYEDLLM